MGCEVIFDLRTWRDLLNAEAGMSLSLKRYQKWELLFLADVNASLGRSGVERRRDLLCGAPAGPKLVSGGDVRVKDAVGWPRVFVQ